MKFNGPFSVHNYSIILITLDPIHFIHTIEAGARFDSKVVIIRTMIKNNLLVYTG
jgi:hypothetical protein